MCGAEDRARWIDRRPPRRGVRTHAPARRCIGNAPSHLFFRIATTRCQALLSGSGGSSASSTSVYLAEDEARRKFAVKVHRVPKDDAAANAQATRELREHARLPPHPHLVRFIAGKVDRTSEAAANVYYVVTEHCPRTAKALLEGAVRRKEPLAEREILNIFTSAAAAVRWVLLWWRCGAGEVVPVAMV